MVGMHSSCGRQTCINAPRKRRRQDVEAREVSPEARLRLRRACRCRERPTARLTGEQSSGILGGTQKRADVAVSSTMSIYIVQAISYLVETSIYMLNRMYVDTQNSMPKDQRYIRGIVFYF